MDHVYFVYYLNLHISRSMPNIYRRKEGKRERKRDGSNLWKTPF
jgi:hypothetical protein